MKKIPRTSIGGLSIHQLITGLWQVADIEKEGHLFDPEDGANELEQYYQDGFGTFDMADHYGSAELIAGRLLARYQDEQHKPIACTKWCPVPGQMTKEVVRKGVQERLDRLGVEQLVDFPAPGLAGCFTRTRRTPRKRTHQRVGSNQFRCCTSTPCAGRWYSHPE
jgi:aryl-alcohol dehydrogenase-like predicted oxidoreductase